MPKQSRFELYSGIYSGVHRKKLVLMRVTACIPLEHVSRGYQKGGAMCEFDRGFVCGVGVMIAVTAFVLSLMALCGVFG